MTGEPCHGEPCHDHYQKTGEPRHEILSWDENFSHIYPVSFQIRKGRITLRFVTSQRWTDLWCHEWWHIHLLEFSGRGAHFPMLGILARLPWQQQFPCVIDITLCNWKCWKEYGPHCSSFTARVPSFHCGRFGGLVTPHGQDNSSRICPSGNWTVAYYFLVFPSKVESQWKRYVDKSVLSRGFALFSTLFVTW